VPPPCGDDDRRSVAGRAKVRRTGQGIFVAVNFCDVPCFEALQAFLELGVVAVNFFFAPARAPRGTSLTLGLERGTLLVAERDHRIDAHGTAGWDIAGHERDADENQRYHCEGQRIRGLHSVKQAG
jgi:hypothetical protein